MGHALAKRWGSSTVGPVVLSVFLLLVLILFALPLWHPHPHPNNIRQRAQLHSMDAALELFNSQFSHYPPSEANDPAGLPYCGAMKLAEAIMGQDLLGFHPQSIFRRDGMSATGDLALYTKSTVSARPGPFLPLESANAWRLEEIYGKGKTGPFPGDAYVLCDAFSRKRPDGQRFSMPILYYRANPAGTAHDVNNPDNPQNIYSYKDNLALINLGVPGDPNAVHPFADPRRFYLNTRSDKITGSAQPYRKDSYLLISAGWDGLYGTPDDICNFEWRYHER
jgi:hypothetical protein